MGRSPESGALGRLRDLSGRWRRSLSGAERVMVNSQANVFRQRRRFPAYWTFTLGSTDIPGLNKCSGSCPFSNKIFTGIRWTTLT